MSVRTPIVRANPHRFAWKRLAPTFMVLAAVACGPSTRPVPPAPPSSHQQAATPTPSPVAPQQGATPLPASVPATPALVPLPSAVSWTGGPGFPVTPSTAIYVPPSDVRAALVGSYLSDWLTMVGSAGPAVVPAIPTEATGKIVLALDPKASVGTEGYLLSVTPVEVRITARDNAGLFYGIQTLRQMLPAFLEHDAARPKPVVIPAAQIKDDPRYEWRGAMLDVARHFFGVDDVKRYVDLMALHKLTRLHLHLSDDQGWRVEIRSWPNLTAMGGRTEVGGGRGGFYTQAEYAEIVAYARDRFIDVVPEIDMPGHTNAALASYADLNCNDVAPPLYTDIKVGFSSLCVTKELTYSFVDDVVREIAALTPGGYFHVGGDEVKTLSAPQYDSFINRVQEIVNRRGKRMLGWDEVASAALLPTSVIQHWRPGTNLAASAAAGIRIIMSPANRTYLDMQYDPATPLGLSWAGRIELRDAYSWDPATLMDGVPESSVLGVEAPLWSETLANMRDVEAMAFPRLAAIAEIGWTAQSQRDWEDFRLRLAGQGPRWQALGVNFYRSPQIPWRP